MNEDDPCRINNILSMLEEEDGMKKIIDLWLSHSSYNHDNIEEVLVDYLLQKNIGLNNLVDTFLDVLVELLEDHSKKSSKEIVWVDKPKPQHILVVFGLINPNIHFEFPFQWIYMIEHLILCTLHFIPTFGVLRVCKLEPEPHKYLVGFKFIDSHPTLQFPLHKSFMVGP